MADHAVGQEPVRPDVCALSVERSRPGCGFDFHFGNGGAFPDIDAGPTVADPVWEVGDAWAGRRYLEDTARTVAATLLILTPENAGYVREAAARMSHASARGAIGVWLSAEAEWMSRRDLTTAFYPSRVAVGPEALAAGVEGELVTWIGREEASRRSSRYRLTFGMDGGRIGLLRFEESGGTGDMTVMNGSRAYSTASGALAAFLAFGSCMPAQALQMLDAVNHAELTAEISGTSVKET